MDFTSQFLMSEISFQVKTYLNFNYIIMGRDTILIRDGNPNPESAVFFHKLSGIRIRNFSAGFGFQFFSPQKYLNLRFLFYVKMKVKYQKMNMFKLGVPTDFLVRII